MAWGHLAISAVGCAGQLALALVAVWRSGRSRLAMLLALLFLDIFAWNLATLLTQLAPQPVWSFIDHTTSPLTAPLALEVVLVFTGSQRRFRRLRALVWLAFALIALIPTARPGWIDSGAWAAALGACAVPTMAFAIMLLALHLRGTEDAHERARARLLLAAVALGTLLGVTDLVGNFIHEFPSLSTLGFLAAGAITMFAAAREQLLEGELTVESAAAAVGLAVASVVAYFALFRLAASQTALVVLGLALITLALAATIRQLASTAALRRVRTTQLTTLGRFAAQMSHDFKNPLAALKGAAQFVQEDLHESGTKRVRMVELMLDQIARMETTIESYRRLARVEPLREEVRLNELVGEVMRLQRLGAGERVSLRTELAEGLPPCKADGGLVANALQNLIRNACEAIEGRGSVTVRTAPPDPSEPPGVVISVEDTGAGMDARTREHAFDDFFTTKAGGSGMGLSFVRRVAEAHGGAVSISSQQGRGTVVRLRLPVA